MNGLNIDIEKVNLSNLEELQIIGKQTFFEAFSNENTEEDMNKYLANKFSIGQLSNELNNPNSDFYFAKIEKEIVGYLKLNFGKGQTEISNQVGIEIERIYVLKQYYGKKVGQALYHKSLQIAKGGNAHYIWLGVWENNPRAIRFYEKNGFVVYDKRAFVLGSAKQTDLLMKLNL